MLCYRTQHHQEGMRQEAKRYVPVPAVPLSYLVLIQANLSLGRLEAIFYGPASVPAIRISSWTGVSTGP